MIFDKQKIGLGMNLIIFIITILITYEVSAESKRQVFSFGPGVHKVGQLILNKPHALLEGEGRGVTILIAEQGIIANAPDPVIRNLTIIGQGQGVGLTLSNTWSAQVQNIEIEKFAIGLLLQMTPEGAVAAGGKTLFGWPGALTKGEHWGSRVTLTEIREVEIMNIKQGIVMRNLLPQGNKGVDGSFFTATTIWGGHIYAREGTGISIGNNVWNTKVIGTFIDIWSGAGIVMERDAWKLTLVGVSMDLSKKKKKKTGADKLIAKSHKAAKSIAWFASDLEQADISIQK